jgi:hypothetical protein
MDKKANTKGYVYFIKCGDYYKVGATKDIYRRFHALQVANPQDITLFHVVKTDDMRLTEKLFQSMFGRIERRGEWFALSEKNLQYIKAGRYNKRIMDSIGDAVKPFVMPDLPINIRAVV